MHRQVYETQTELTEAREELELLKLKLDVADQEAQAAKRQAAEATAATSALLQAHNSPGLPSPVNRRSLSREVCMNVKAKVEYVYGKLQCGLQHWVAQAVHGSPYCIWQPPPPCTFLPTAPVEQKHSLFLR